jgi:hypothetical protein
MKKRKHPHVYFFLNTNFSTRILLLSYVYIFEIYVKFCVFDTLTRYV